MVYIGMEFNAKKSAYIRVTVVIRHNSDIHPIILRRLQIHDHGKMKSVIWVLLSPPEESLPSYFQNYRQKFFRALMESFVRWV